MALAAQQCEPNDLSSVSGTHVQGKERTSSMEVSSGPHIQPDKPPLTIITCKHNDNKEAIFKNLVQLSKYWWAAGWFFLWHWPTSMFFLIKTFFFLPLSRSPPNPFSLCVCSFSYLNVCMWGSLRPTWGLCLSCSPPYVLSQGLALILNSLLARPAAQLTPGVSLLLSPSIGTTEMQCSIFPWVPRDPNVGPHASSISTH